MSLTTAVAAQFKLILRKECMTGPHQWNGGCVFHLSTAVLGYLLILVVSLAQIPLLFKILRYKQDKTLIHPFSIGLMALMASNNVAYAVNRNLPISTWGEGVVQILQYLIIINLLFIHQGSHRKAVAFTLVYVTLMVGSLTPCFPAKLLVFLKLLNMPMDVVSKIILMYQYQYHQQGAAVSPVSSRRSIALLNLCSLGRFLTACVHSHDNLLIATYGEECVCTLALSTVAMVFQRRWRKRNLKNIDDTDDDDDDGDDDRKRSRSRRTRIVEECCEEYSLSNSSGGEELVYGGDGEEERLRRRRRKMRRVWAVDAEGEDELSGGSGVDDSGYFSESMRRRRKLRRNRVRFGMDDYWDGEMSSSYSSGVEECLSLRVEGPHKES